MLFLSAKSSRKDREYAKRCGADAYITKPFDIGELLKLITSIIAKPNFKVRKKKYTPAHIQESERLAKSELSEKRQKKETQDRYSHLKDFLNKNI